VDNVKPTCATVRTDEAAQGAPVDAVEELGSAAALRLRHDLRQPLATMGLLVEAITSTGGLPPNVVTALRQIEHETEWMGRLLNITADNRGDVAVVDLATTVARPFSITPPSAPYQVRFNKLDDAAVLVDPVGLERAARNLMDNATRAVSRGGTVDVRVWAEDRHGVLEVADSGPGFGHLAPQHGHGLVGVRGFAERFGGDLVCGPSSLGGALVTLRLPLASGW
jgi:signal transduction histidine kinase